MELLENEDLLCSCRAFRRKNVILPLVFFYIGFDLKQHIRKENSESAWKYNISKKYAPAEVETHHAEKSVLVGMGKW